jgi:transposase
MSTKRDFSGMKQRRMEAAKLLAAGVKPAEIARRLGVSRQSVSRWQKMLKKSGKKGLEGSGRVGRPRKISPEEIRKIERALVRGVRACGIDADLWTLARVAKIIKSITGHSFGISGVWYVLRRLGWSVQRPAKQAAERDQTEVDRWIKETWPAVKKTPGNKEP